MLRLVTSIHHARLRYRDFRQLGRVLRVANDCTLRSLYLPPPILNVDLMTPRYKFPPGFQTLLSSCRDRKIEVVFEQAGYRGLEAVVSSEFCKRQRELKKIASTGWADGQRGQEDQEME